MKPWQPVLDFWFGDREPPEPAFQKRWFSGGADVDQQIEQRFGELHRRAVDGELAAWLEHPEGRLAKIVLVDQFSRNLYRGTARAFAWDDLAQSWALEALANSHYGALAPSGRMFCLMPLMHSENPELHARLKTEIRRLQADFPDRRDFLQGFAGAAEEHRVIIERFGRYPHRNASLDRPSTDAEVAYLAESKNRFGQ